MTSLPKLPKSAPNVQLPSLTVAPGQTIQFLLKLTLPSDSKLNEEAPNSWFITAEGKVPVLFYQLNRSRCDTKWVISWCACNTGTSAWWIRMSLPVLCSCLTLWCNTCYLELIHLTAGVWRLKRPKTPDKLPFAWINTCCIIFICFYFLGISCQWGLALSALSPWTACPSPTACFREKAHHEAVAYSWKRFLSRAFVFQKSIWGTFIRNQL